MVNKKEKIAPIKAKPVTKSVTNLVESFVTNDVTKSVTKNVTEIKRMNIGEKVLIAEFISKEKIRPNYSLNKETVNKIEEVAKRLGYKKSEFLDIYLNATLTEILEKY